MMSKIGNYVVGLQERPEYKQGWEAFEVGGVRCDNVFTGELDYEQRVEAWYLGFDDAKLTAMTQFGEPQ
jgi:hypothetical protein